MAVFSTRAYFVKLPLNYKLQCSGVEGIRIQRSLRGTANPHCCLFKCFFVFCCCCFVSFFLFYSFFFFFFFKTFCRGVLAATKSTPFSSFLGGGLLGGLQLRLLRALGVRDGGSPQAEHLRGAHPRSAARSACARVVSASGSHFLSRCTFNFLERQF